jgi:hypothetical protein
MTAKPESVLIRTMPVVQEIRHCSDLQVLCGRLHIEAMFHISSVLVVFLSMKEGSRDEV